PRPAMRRARASLEWISPLPLPVAPPLPRSSAATESRREGGGGREVRLPLLGGALPFPSRPGSFPPWLPQPSPFRAELGPPECVRQGAAGATHFLSIPARRAAPLETVRG